MLPPSQESCGRVLSPGGFGQNQLSRPSPVSLKLPKANKWGRLLLLTAGLTVLWSNRIAIIQAFKRLFPGKELWDYMDVLLVPIVIFIVGFAIDKRGKAREEALKSEGERIRKEELKNQVLQEFFDRISAILLDKQVLGLAKAAESLNNHEDPLVESAREVVRARTLSILRFFSDDIEKKSAVVRFLIDSDILRYLRVSLAGADLKGAMLNGARLCNANLNKADLRGVDMSFARLVGSNLEEANLSQARLTKTHFNGAQLFGADLRKAEISISNFTGASLSMADLSGADLSETNLSHSDLFQSKLIGANLSRAMLWGADLGEASLSGANLEGVKWDDSTRWPDRHSFRSASNIPEALKIKIGL